MTLSGPKLSPWIKQTIASIGTLDKDAMTRAEARQNMLTKPKGSLGRLEDVSIQLAGIQGKAVPVINHKAVITMAADHGVVAEKVGNWPQDVTAQMVLNFLNGGAAINVLARHAGARVVVVDMGVATELRKNPKLVSHRMGPGTANMAVGPAMTPAQAVAAMEAGIQVFEEEYAKGLDIVGTGDMGIGNTTASSAICAVITGKPVSEVTGRGTGIDDKMLRHKIEVIERALAVNQPDTSHRLSLLSKIGGFEIAGLVGVMFAAAANRVAVVIDGFISGAAALVATALAPALKPYLIASHMSAEVGHRIMLEYMGLRPLLDLDMRLGEGTGAALGIEIVETAVRVLNEMATFDQAGVAREIK